MFKKIISILIILAVLGCVSGCKKSNQKDNNKNNRVESSSSSKTESKSKEDSKPKSNAVLKEEIFENLDLTYGELTEKYGAKTEVVIYENMPHLRFEEHLEWGGMRFSGYESEDADYSVITDRDKVSALVFKANEVFDNDKSKIYFSDLEKLFDCSISVSINEAGSGFFSEFKYKDYNFKIYASTPEYLSRTDIIYITK